MRRMTFWLLVALLTGSLAGPASPVVCHAQKAEIDVQEEANILYDEAIELKKQGKLDKAVDAYHRAMRKDRAILAFDDAGLIEDLKKDCEAKIAADPKDVKSIETLAFVEAVCYSDYESAIRNYERVVELVSDDQVKERTQTLIDRLRETAAAQQQFSTQVVQEIREERLKSWSEMERIERFGAEAAEAQAKAQELAEKYKEKDSLKNRVPQLEQELKDLQEEYDKANRLWFSLKDDLYNRRRRRLKDDIEAKEKEVEEAKEQLDEVEDATARLEREVQVQTQKQEKSVVKTYENYPNSGTGNETGTGADVDPAAEPPAGNASGDGDTGNDAYEQQPLPAGENPDFPMEPADVENETPEEREKRLQELINNL